MNIKKIVIILISILLISLTIASVSLRYNDNLNFKDLASRNKLIKINNNHSNVNIGSKGIQINDGDEYVSIGWDGIKIIDGNEKVYIGWDGIRIDDGNKTKINIGNIDWFSRNNLEWFTFDEEKIVELNNRKNINISSTFVDIVIIPENRDDIEVHYKGEMKANAAPKLNIFENNNSIEIKLVDRNNFGYTVTNSDLILKVHVPSNYNENIKISSTSSFVSIGNLSLKDLLIESTSGNMQIDDVKANFIKLNSTSGDVNLRKSSGKLNIYTTSGNIDIDNKSNSEDIKAESVSGNIFINFARNANYSIEGSSVSGNLKSSIIMDEYTSNNAFGSNEFKGKINNGKSKILLETVSGDINFNME